MSCFKTMNRTVVQCSCGSVVEHYVSRANVVGSISREHTYWQYICIAWMHCKSLWIKASAKCINVNVVCSIPELQSFQFQLFSSVSSKEEMTGNRIVLLILLVYFIVHFWRVNFFCLILTLLFPYLLLVYFFIKNKSKAQTYLSPLIHLFTVMIHSYWSMSNIYICLLND